MKTVGHPRNLNSPEQLWGLFEEYKIETKANPRRKHVFVGKDGISEFESLERPLTIEGFKEYCYERVGMVRQYLDNEGDRYSEYLNISARIKETIRRDQIEGGMVGQYNANITARLNGLVDKKETEVKGEPRIFNID